jgi:hypothetical protein
MSETIEKRRPGRPRKNQDAPEQQDGIAAGTMARVVLSGQGDAGMIPYVGMSVQVQRQLAEGLYEVTTAQGDSMAFPQANLDTSEQPAMTWNRFKVLLRGKDVATCWFPDPPVSLLELGNNVMARVREGEPGYQLVTGEVVTL